MTTNPVSTVLCSRCGNPDNQMCDCSLPGLQAQDVAGLVEEIARQAFFEGVAEGAYPTGEGRDPQSVWLKSGAYQALASFRTSPTREVEGLVEAAADNNREGHCSPSGGWQPMATVPKYAAPVLLKFKDELPRADLTNWCGRAIVAIYQGKHSEWCFAAPVGQGGFPDEWFQGWAPLPEAASAAASTNNPPQEGKAS